MTTTRSTYDTATRALLFGTAPTVLKLSYDRADPAAVRLELTNLRKHWYVARDRLASGLEYQADAFDEDDYAGDVHCSQLSVTGRTLLVLRDRPLGRYPLSVCTDALSRFLGVTWRICPAGLEWDLVSDALTAQLGMFATTQGEPS